MKTVSRILAAFALVAIFSVYASAQVASTTVPAKQANAATAKAPVKTSDAGKAGVCDHNGPKCADQGKNCPSKAGNAGCQNHGQTCKEGQKSDCCAKGKSAGCCAGGQKHGEGCANHNASAPAQPKK